MRRSVALVMILLAAGCGAQSPPAPPPSASETSSRPPSALRPPGPVRPTAQRRQAREPSRAAEAKPVKVPYTASGRYSVVRGRAPARPGPGEVVRYLVEVEGGLPFDGDAFAAAVHRTLNDPRGWARFQRVDDGPVRVRVALSSPAMTDRQCLPLRTGGDLSCWNGTRSIINARRWATGVPQYEGDLAAYRDYVISHEVGHSLGHDHTGCPGLGRPAPVMAQQSKSLGGCRPNPWPYPSRPKDQRPGHDR